MGYKRVNKSTAFTNHTIQISKHTAYYLHSDGIVDQAGGAKGFGYGNKRLRNLLLENYRKPFSDQKKLIIQSLADYQGTQLRRDDVTVVGFSL